VPEDYRSKRITFQFEGVYRDAMVFINGEFAAQRPYGYSNFYVPADAFLRYGQSNTIRVVARAHQDSRWYTGLGILRDTRVIVKELMHLGPCRPSGPRATRSCPCPRCGCGSSLTINCARYPR
jgi:beta-galactosidase